MPDEKLPGDLVLSEAQFRKVIELAVRVTPRSEGVSVAELRQIARDLDIDQDSLARALSVVLAQPQRSQSTRSWLSTQATRLGMGLGRVLPRRGRLIASGLVGGLLGWLSAYVGLGLREVINGMIIMRGSTSYLDVAIFIVLSLLTLANSLSRRVDGRRRRYLAETVMTWSTLALAWAITHGSATADLLTAVALSMAAFGLWGWLIIRPRGSDGAGLLVKTQVDVTEPGAPERTNDERGTLLEWTRLAFVIQTTLVPVTRAQRR